MKIILIFSILLLLTACSARTYIQEGVNVGKKESYAVLSTRNDPNDTSAKLHVNRVFITKLNGESLYNFFKEPKYPERALLIEGVNTFRIHYNSMWGFANYCLWVDAKAGDTYIIRKQDQGRYISFWVESQITNSVVGGACESEPTKAVKIPSLI